MVESTEKKSAPLRNKPNVMVWGAVVLVLLLPLIAMQFTEEVSWDFMDFVVAGALLSFAAMTFEMASRKFVDSKSRWVVGIAILALLLIVWVQLAVGIV